MNMKQNHTRMEPGCTRLCTSENPTGISTSYMSHPETSKSIKIADCLKMRRASAKREVPKQGMLEYKF